MNPREHKCTPFAALHGRHGCFDIVMVAVYLLFEILFAVIQVLQGIMHIGHLLLTLEALPVFATDIACNCIEDALETIAPCDFPEFF